MTAQCSVDRAVERGGREPGAAPSGGSCTPAARTNALTAEALVFEQLERLHVVALPKPPPEQVE